MHESNPRKLIFVRQVNRLTDILLYLLMSGDDYEILRYTVGDDFNNTIKSGWCVGAVSRDTTDRMGKGVVFYKKESCQDHERKLQEHHYTWRHGFETYRGTIRLGRRGSAIACSN